MHDLFEQDGASRGIASDPLPRVVRGPAGLALLPLTALFATALVGLSLLTFSLSQRIKDLSEPQADVAIFDIFSIREVTRGDRGESGSPLPAGTPVTLILHPLAEPEIHPVYQIRVLKESGEMIWSNRVVSRGREGVFILHLPEGLPGGRYRVQVYSLNQGQTDLIEAYELRCEDPTREDAAVGSHGEAGTLVRASLREASLRETSFRETSLREASLREAYALQIDRLMELAEAKPGRGFDERALQISERVRTRSLLDLLASPSPTLGLKGLQRGVLDDETALLEYSLGEQHSFLWLVTADSLESFKLPARAEIEELALRTHQLLSRSHQRGFRAQADVAVRQLSQVLLGPAASSLKPGLRLAFVTDGALQYVPISALSNPITGAPLIADHEVVTLPSASILAALRQRLASRPPAPRTLAVLADPVFGPDDPRLRVEEPIRFARSYSPTRLESGGGAAGFPRLPFSRREAQAIAALVPPSERFAALGFDANRNLATSGGLKDYRYIHFATHGVLDVENPERSGLVLSQIGRDGRPQNGLLTTLDVFGLSLPADLVVLSACETALGKEVQGEGLIGLTQSFMQAGAPRVVASLWQVSDMATSRLMERFYQGILRDGLTPASALRRAQIEMMREPRWEAPYYWAGFSLQGEWK